MREKKFTPGPWRVMSDVEDYAFVRGEKCCVVTLDRRRDGHEPFRNRTLADAHLMAAAPELLLALEACTDHAHPNAYCPDCDHITCKALRAIAKAYGDTP